MKRRLLIALEDAVLAVDTGSGRAAVGRLLEGRAPRALAAAGDLVFCGTMGHGVWSSADGGTTWRHAGGELRSARVMSVAAIRSDAPPVPPAAAPPPGSSASPAPAAGVPAAPVDASENAPGIVVCCGTEPSALWYSADGGTTWHPLARLNTLPSASEWSFPPRPDTHHVRAIAFDPRDVDRIYACIEAGALIRSSDGGATWQDRVPGSPRDTHTLALHPRDPHRLYAAAGDGYFESRDGGDTWERPREGLSAHYMWSVLAHHAEPETRVVTASPGPREAHSAADAVSYVYRRTRAAEWERCPGDLPEPAGMTVPTLAHDARDADTFWLACNHGAFVSRDAGEFWRPVPFDAPDEMRAQRIRALLVLDR